jgi:3-hydroxyacyl-[acyl-carrier-protein] dehydratase
MSNVIGVRYCGGCNTTYDREAAVKQLQELLPDCAFVIAEAGKR